MPLQNSIDVPANAVNTKLTYVPIFSQMPIMSAKTGGTAAVTINTTNCWSISQYGAYFEQYNTTVASNIAPSFSSTAGQGLNIDNIGAGNAKTIEITEGVDVSCKNQFVAGTSAPFYVQATFNINTLASVADVNVGFRKLQAYNATLSNYTDFAACGVHSTAGLIQTSTQIASGGVLINTASVTVSPSTNFTVRVNVSAAGVLSCVINGTPATITAYTFGAVTVIPYIYYTSAAGAHAEVDLVAYQCGLQ